eukprot:TRINITY_DN5027_c0_g1_i1.p1 TRINITY_DN5027_c0_g1~~TRINITY_DN5027_c0_g1_i1.p1  ORF type:complete len:175 (+),score=67.38 TRINITY_DN5027_c0_g1_i1:3-527(+)
MTTQHTESNLVNNYNNSNRASHSIEGNTSSSSPASLTVNTDNNTNGNATTQQHLPTRMNTNGSTNKNASILSELGTAIPKRSSDHKIVLPSFVFQEMIVGLSYCIFKPNHRSTALKAVRKIHQRACYEMLPDLMISANTILFLQEKEQQDKQPASLLPPSSSFGNLAIATPSPS